MCEDSPGFQCFRGQGQWAAGASLSVPKRALDIGKVEMEGLTRQQGESCPVPSSVPSPALL